VTFIAFLVVYALFYVFLVTLGHICNLFQFGLHMFSFQGILLYYKCILYVIALWRIMVQLSLFVSKSCMQTQLWLRHFRCGRDKTMLPSVWKLPLDMTSEKVGSPTGPLPRLHHASASGAKHSPLRTTTCIRRVCS
jgi:hypothetical protein